VDDQIEASRGRHRTFCQKTFFSAYYKHLIKSLNDESN
ncbi:uncharacterized protein METZ01_LOCUS242503, partial [marine metagenome]